MNLLEKVLEYIFLPSCGVCGKLGEGYLCKKCEKELENYLISIESKEKHTNTEKMQERGKKLIRIESKEKEVIPRMHIFKYENVIRKLIIQYKFNNKSYLYKTFCEFIVKNKKAFDFIKSYDIIIPVPMHRKKKARRGYNQTELIVKELAKKVGIQVVLDVLVKTKINKVQSSLDKEERKNNVKNVYKLTNQEKIKNKKVLIFDDIYTTGATIEACIEEVLKAEVKQIGVLTLAKD